MPRIETIITDPAVAAARFSELDGQGVEFTVVKTISAYVGGEATDAEGNVIATPNTSSPSYAFRVSDDGAEPPVHVSSEERAGGSEQANR